MKTLSRIGLGALLAAVSMSAAWAQSSTRPTDPAAPKTRAEVKADLVEWRAARIVAERHAQQAGAGLGQ
ncbi:MAG: FIG00453996: hypothetical protein [uncultured Paraburkholderia sp.]|nr:MAG: FIG00453996: hypothetical protein [uncultured Paraburkholderia sp.]CAH2785542.1 MAG: FIG00453996: hypothetical protein [uncultured Paraburkholderia sp.]CAH2895681.1 MAG: FIG00453996: hypothetical protein [uncultured Paraburkholderia sp.]CAH2919125.1 MAG: FIG00453996: hypothetical protein [uncultured Paraburkholderia sp.]CAH2922819.1 MAG: FIG00453996: hypothetical protein [uncultured Paraburkholderia sp.]